MPVWKYRDVSEMPPPPRATREVELVARVRALWRRTARFGSMGYAPGVFKFRTLEESQAARALNRQRRALRR